MDVQKIYISGKWGAKMFHMINITYYGAVFAIASVISGAIFYVLIVGNNDTTGKSAVERVVADKVISATTSVVAETQKNPPPETVKNIDSIPIKRDDSSSNELPITETPPILVAPEKSPFTEQAPPSQLPVNTIPDNTVECNTEKCIQTYANAITACTPFEAKIEEIYIKILGMKSDLCNFHISFTSGDDSGLGMTCNESVDQTGVFDLSEIIYSVTASQPNTCTGSLVDKYYREDTYIGWLLNDIVSAYKKVDTTEEALSFVSLYGTAKLNQQTEEETIELFMVHGMVASMLSGVKPKITLTSYFATAEYYYDEKNSITLSLKKEGQEWKLDDIETAISVSVKFSP